MYSMQHLIDFSFDNYDFIINIIINDYYGI